MTKNVKTQISTADCRFEGKVLMVATEVVGGFPKQIDVVSSHTGKVVTFVQDTKLAMEKEFWDGEMMAYLPTTEVKNVKALAISNFLNGGQ